MNFKNFLVLVYTILITSSLHAAQQSQSGNARSSNMQVDSKQSAELQVATLATKLTELSSKVGQIVRDDKQTLAEIEANSAEIKRLQERNASLASQRSTQVKVYAHDLGFWSSLKNLSVLYQQTKDAICKKTILFAMVRICAMSIVNKYEIDFLLDQNNLNQAPFNEQFNLLGGSQDQQELMVANAVHELLQKNIKDYDKVLRQAPQYINYVTFGELLIACITKNISAWSFRDWSGRNSKERAQFFNKQLKEFVSKSS